MGLTPSGSRQLSFIDTPETEALKRWHRLDDGYEFAHVSDSDVRHMESGIEIIIVHPGCDAKGFPNMERNHYYRAITKRCRMGYGEEVKLISQPSEEWPEKPPWASWGSDGQWVLPGWGDWYFVRKDVVPE